MRMRHTTMRNWTLILKETRKKKNYMKAACMRMIKNYLDRMYDGWKFYEKDYLIYVNDFKRFG